MPRLGCGYCFQTLDPGDPDPERASFRSCMHCQRLYHRGCWRDCCTTPTCTSTKASHATVAAPDPLAVDIDCPYPVLTGPNNYLHDHPLGVSCGTYFEDRGQTVLLRNHTAMPMELPLTLGPPWTTLRLASPKRNDPDQEPWPDSMILDPGETRTLEIHIHKARPPFALRRIPLGYDKELWVRTGPARGVYALGMLGFFVLFFLHWGLTVSRPWNAFTDLVVVTLSLGLLTSWTTLLAPSLLPFLITRLTHWLEELDSFWPDQRWLRRLAEWAAAPEEPDLYEALPRRLVFACLTFLGTWFLGLMALGLVATTLASIHATWTGLILFALGYGLFHLLLWGSWLRAFDVHVFSLLIRGGRQVIALFETPSKAQKTG